MDLDQGFRFGPAIVRPRAGTIEIDGKARRLDHKPMQVLLCLAARPSATVAKESLFEQVWNGASISDDVLTVAISALRRALDDDARAPRFIQTVPREGYRAVAPVRPLGPAFPPWALAASLLVTALLLFLAARPEPPERAKVDAIAVMPLANHTGDDDQRYLADGMTEALIARLASDTSLRVIARSSVMALDPSLDSVAAAGLLSVDALVEGSVQRVGETLRVTVQLIDGAAGDHLWAATFDAPFADVLRLEGRVADALLGRLNRQLGSAAAVAAVDPAAYERYLQGRYLLHRGSIDDLRAALDHFGAAIGGAPSFASGHLAIAETHVLLAREGAEAAAAAFEAAREAVAEALRLDPRLARAHAVRGGLLYLEAWDFEAAEAAFEAALDLDRSDPVILDAWARYLAVVGRFDQALAAVGALRSVDPRAYSRPQVAAILNLARRHEEALVELEAQRAVEPRSPLLALELALTHMRLGQLDAAFAAYGDYLRLLGNDEASVRQAEAAFRREGPKGVYRQLLDASDRSASGGRVQSLVSTAELAAGAGERARALDALEQAIAIREAGVVAIGTSLSFDGLRGDPRFEALVARIGLPEAAGPRPGNS